MPEDPEIHINPEDIEVFLGGGPCQDLHRHLASCPECRRLVERHREAQAMLQKLRGASKPAGDDCPVDWKAPKKF